ncbi:MAG: efflux RND transporter permease subunit [Rhodocyclaceae bacterium]|nr:efflux RND transporter permease subunit [Rhodocyclaceae bacterium]
MFEAIVRRGTLLAVGILVVCLFGIMALLRVPVQMIPDLEVRTISIRTHWPGATPQDVEKEILIEQERYLRNVPGVQRMLSSASTGSARVELEFPFGTDINDTLIRVSNALSQVSSYPENVDEPRIFTTSFSSNSFMFFRVQPLPGNPRGLRMEEMNDFLDERVRTRLERIDGVSEVRIWGGVERQAQVFVEPRLLAERGVTLAEVRDALRARNRDVSGGDVDSGKRRYLLRTVGRFDDVAQIEELIIRRDGDAILRLRDIGHVEMGFAEIRSKTFVNGERAVNLSIRREPGSNVIAIKDAVLAEVAAINRSVLAPAGMVMNATTDDVRYVEAAVANVWQNLLLGAALATGVMYLFLRSLPATLIGVAGIPVCTIASFLGLLLAGRTINVVSLAGVAFAIGMTLDNSIVVLESIERELARGRKRLDAAIVGVRQVWSAVLASTLTTVLVFLPVLFVREEAGQLYSDIAVALSAAILVSMAVALLVIPTAFVSFEFREDRRPSRIGAALGAAIVDGSAWLAASGWRRTLCVTAVAGLALLAFARLTPPAEYLPDGEEPKSFSLMFAPSGYSIEEMSAAAEAVQQRLMPAVGDDPSRFLAGKTDVPAISYMLVIVQSEQVRLIAEPVDWDVRNIEGLMDVVVREFRAIPGMRAFSSRGSIFASNYGGTRSVNVDVSGDDLGEIYAVAEVLRNKAEALFDNPRIRSDPSSLSLGQPLIEIRPNWQRLAELGIDNRALGYAVAATADGTYLDEIFLGDEKIDIYLYSSQGRVSRLDQIGAMPVVGRGGAVLPLASVADLIETVDTENVRRVDGRRTVTLSIIPPREVALETAVATVRSGLVEAARASGAIPDDVNVQLSGASDALDATRSALTGNFVVAVLLCYLLLVAIFSHWGYPFLIMTTVPLGIGGGIVGLWLLNAAGQALPKLGLPPFSQAFDMITMLGFLILVGTVVNNPILIVDRAIRNLREEAMDARDAVRDAVASRLRPIAMSTITTVCGLSPLVLVPGAGSELYRGLGAIVLFGLVFTMLVTLSFLPALLVSVLEWRAARGGAGKRSD